MAAPKFWELVLSTGANAYLQDQANDRLAETNRLRNELAAVTQQSAKRVNADVIKTGLWVGGFVVAAVVYSRVRKKRKA